MYRAFPFSKGSLHKRTFSVLLSLSLSLVSFLPFLITNTNNNPCYVLIFTFSLSLLYSLFLFINKDVLKPEL